MGNGGNKILQSRREFFKKAAKTSLPVVGMAIFASTPFFFSCTKEPDPSGCGTCTGSCSGACSDSCVGSSTGTTCSSCGSNCSTGCSTSCGNGCTNDCSSNCSNSSNNSPNETISEASGSIDGHEYVDLGLSVKWARYNIGASKPQQSGTKGSPSFYNMGDIEKRNFLYQHGLYSTTSIISEVGGMREFDVATEKWGDNWKTPSTSECQELIDNCDFELFTYNNIEGVKVTSRINRKSIFVHLTGGYNSVNGGWTSVGYRAEFPSSSFRTGLGVVGLATPASGLDLYKSNNGIATRLYGPGMKYYTRAVTTGSGGGSTNCNGNCTNTATNNCSSCQIGCSSTCTQQCSSNCSTGCKSNCTGSCINGCNTGCGGSCHYSCGGTCSYVSSGSHCTSGTCATTCSSYCYRTCSLACSQSCQSCCITSAK